MSDKYKSTELSDCCQASVTFFDFTLVCKSCYAEQDWEVLS